MTESSTDSAASPVPQSTPAPPADAAAGEPNPAELFERGRAVRQARGLPTIPVSAMVSEAHAEADPGSAPDSGSASRSDSAPDSASEVGSDSAPRMLYSVRHLTEYFYDGPIGTSYGRAHVLPRDTPHQRVLESTLQVEPEPSGISTHADYFGNASTYVEVTDSHTRLALDARSIVEVTEPRYDAEIFSRPWEQIRAGLAKAEWDDDVPPIEFVLNSPRIQHVREVDELADDAFAPGRPIGDALAALIHGIYTDLEYKSGSTTVRTTLAELFAQRRGVCQDFAHLAVAAARSRGLAARYVSGYLRTFPLPGQTKLEGSDASHAWASVLVPGAGWVDIDPTNNTFADARFVTTAWGRDYGDVPPMKGVVFSSGAASTLKVSVDVKPVDEEDPVVPPPSDA